MAAQKEDKKWKLDAETTIRTVQTSGNQLEERVWLMVEESIRVRLDQEDKTKDICKKQQEMEEEITVLQQDAMDQDTVDKEQQRKIDHLEKLMEDLVDRITAIEDRAN
jgi:hypothetical protein